MKKLYALMLVGALTAGAYAQECTKSKASCDKSKAAACCASKDKASAACCANKGASDAEVARKAGFKMPAIEYVVGTERTCCDKMATELANGDKSKIRFAVAKDTFDKMADAETAYGKVLDSTLTDLTSDPQYAVAGECMRCPVSAKAATSSSVTVTI